MFDTVLLLNLQAFCGEICEGVRVWLEEYKDDMNVQNSLSELLQVQTQSFFISPGIFVQWVFMNSSIENKDLKNLTNEKKLYSLVK